MQILNILNKPTKEQDGNSHTISTERSFITANTTPITLQEINDKHIIPVFVKDNEPVISHADFISNTLDVVQHIFSGETILNPSIRISHPIKGRIPDAKEKPANQLLESEKTVYYERMAFAIEVPSITDAVSGNTLSLTVGGIKAYNLDKLHNKKGTDEHFKIFIGFQNKVCTNLCVSTDGYLADLTVKSLDQLIDAIHKLIINYNAKLHLDQLKQLSHYTLTETQFAQLIGKCRMYQFLPLSSKKIIHELNFGDTQLGLVVKDYYNDTSFCRNPDGAISLWQLYNLFTGANKSSYIDTFLDRGLNAFEFVSTLANIVKNREYSWFLN